ncbi:hypothetical protein A3C60_00010 [Candidatus Nomurabacteria bacterium RIFCSPHIGHO2_02_FULL_37_45]|uniref:Uncharacterized protein n=1 Tax=Candidatus Nomurabacteria bacterium RIFCSPHIGHO2_12_FULL_37_29 TaxID=1801759 RepID=A0A1F6WAP1_9BACT|nr:MAG: hypothetical protein A3C60_00010 [Candidatus Nomurabacteria bacterium RIFCSPHIGHO2_02_FULL_37_45]OGI78968.1 MAG: hypothetical protein A3F19_03025 [Candidatus Nomurabacteria bacterium RIFCSPHIGHO2_12_FULL_37_29]
MKLLLTSAGITNEKIAMALIYLFNKFRRKWIYLLVSKRNSIFFRHYTLFFNFSYPYYLQISWKRISKKVVILVRIMSDSVGQGHFLGLHYFYKNNL